MIASLTPAGKAASAPGGRAREVVVSDAATALVPIPLRKSRRETFTPLFSFLLSFLGSFSFSLITFPF